MPEPRPRMRWQIKKSRIKLGREKKHQNSSGTSRMPIPYVCLHLRPSLGTGEILPTHLRGIELYCTCTWEGYEDGTLLTRPGGRLRAYGDWMETYFASSTLLIVRFLCSELYQWCFPSLCLSRPLFAGEYARSLLCHQHLSFWNGATLS
jgi:hypothetical protein